MEKYNAETMAIVHKDLLERIKCLMRFHTQAGNCIEIDDIIYSAESIYKDINKALINAAPPVEPVVPLSEVLELLDKHIINLPTRNEFEKGFRSAFGAAANLIEQKYGVSE